MHSPEKAINELKKYSNLLMKKTGLNRTDFDKELENLKKIIKFEKDNEYSLFFKKAVEISPDKNDVDFFALSLKYSCILWSNDTLLKSQNKIKVLTTKEIISLFF